VRTGVVSLPPLLGVAAIPASSLANGIYLSKAFCCDKDAQKASRDGANGQLNQALAQDTGDGRRKSSSTRTVGCLSAPMAVLIALIIAAYRAEFGADCLAEESLTT